MDQARLERSAALVRRFHSTLGLPNHCLPSAMPLSSLLPSEGVLPPGVVACEVDPWGRLRQHHDVPPKVGLGPQLRAQGQVVHRELARAGFADPTPADYHEHILLPVEGGPPDAKPFELRIVNMVHTNYVSPDPQFRDVDSDEESLVKGGRGPGKSGSRKASRKATEQAFHQTARHWRRLYAPLNPDTEGDEDEDEDEDEDDDGDDDDDEEEEEVEDEDDDQDDDDDYGSNNNNNTRFPAAGQTRFRGKVSRPLVSMRKLQRTWLELGYHKNQVRTGLGIRFAAPWSCSQLFFLPGRVQTTGSQRRRIDRILLKYATCAYLGMAGLPHVSLKRRLSQNVVAGCHLPTPNGLCVGLFCHRNRDYAKAASGFPGIVIENPATQPAKMLAFVPGNVVCVGAKSVEQLTRAFATQQPEFRANFRTEATEAMELELVAKGALRGFPAAQLQPKLLPAREKRKREEENAEAERARKRARREVETAAAMDDV